MRKNLITVSLVVVAALLFLGCSNPTEKKPSQAEPPFSFGEGAPGQQVRSIKLANLALDKGEIIYNVEYPVTGLTSIAKLEYPSKALVEETFPQKWKVVYTYKDTQDKYLQIPSSFTVYGYSENTGAYERSINKYDRVEAKLGEVVYRDNNGTIRKIPADYFSVAGSGMP